MRISIPSHWSYIAVLALLTSCGGGSSTPTTPLAFQQNHITGKYATPCPCLYVANIGNDRVGGGSTVTVYAAGATGNAKPIQTIAGPKTGLITSFGIAVDVSGNIYVANDYGNSVTIYAAGATGNVAPTRTISGNYTGVAQPDGIALDPVNGDIYVANLFGGPSETASVTIYAPGATGNIPPIGTITGANTGLRDPSGLTLDASGNIYVPNNYKYGPSVTVYAAGTVGNVAPTHTINGTKTGLYAPYQLALDAGENINIGNWADALVYAAGAYGNVRPLRTIKGKATKLDGAAGIALDSSGNRYVTSSANSTDSWITVYAPGAKGNAKPINEIKGSRTRLDEPVAIAIR